MEAGAILWLLAVASGIGAEKFVVIQDKSNIVATEGETVVIPCRHNVMHKVWSLQWFKGARKGIKVTSETAEYRDHFLQTQGGDPSTYSIDVSLRLKYVRPSDSGMYFCKLEAIKWEMYGAGTNLTVRGKSRNFTVTQGQSSISAAEGETVLMVCSHNAIHSGDTVLYTWYRNTTEVSNGTAEYAGRVLGPEQEDSFKASIKLTDVRESDSGMYYCKVRIDGIGEQIGDGVRLTVSHTRIGAEKFVVIQDKSSIVAMEGESVVIPCRHNITHKVWSYHWVKGARKGIKVTSETAEYRDRFLQTQGGDPSTYSIDISLRLKYVRPSDSGMYFCKLEAIKWEMCGPGTNLTVRGKSRSFTVTQGQSSISAAEGETVLMVCSHNANHSGDTVLYSWYRNTTEVSNGTAEYAGRVLGPEQEDSFKASIKLTDVRESDSGMYYCKVRIDGIGEQIGDGVRLTVSHTRKLKSTVILLVILLAALGIQGSILLVSILFCRKTCCVAKSVPVEGKELFPLNKRASEADLTSPQLDEGPGTEFQPEGESTYAPMQSLKSFCISTDNGTGVSTQHRQDNSPVPDAEVPTVESIQYAVIYPSYSRNQAPAKASVEDDDLEKEYGYDELNVTAKRSL